MKFKSLVVCETCLVDGRTNALSFINVLEEINLTTVPAMIHKVSVIAMLGQEFPGENPMVPLDIAVTLDGELILSEPITVDFKGRQDTRFILEINGVPLKSGGLLKFAVKQNGNEMLEYVVKVHMQDQLVTRPQ